jgi:Uma2 family endonuclease
MAPQGHPHAFALMRLFWYLAKAVPDEQYEVRMQCPFVTSGKSVPEPDVAVCTQADAARKPHPSHAALIIEIAYSSLEADRALADEYAAAGVPEYWIMDVDNRRVEVFRQPVEDMGKALGFRYAEVRVLTAGDEIAPAVAPLAATPVGIFFT